MNSIEQGNEQEMDESNHSFGSLNRSIALKQQTNKNLSKDQKLTIKSVDSNNFYFNEQENLKNLKITKPSLKNLFENDLKDLTSNIVSKNKSFVNLNQINFENNTNIRPISKESYIPKCNNSL